MLVDVNVLVAAFRADHAHHAIARKWLLERLEDTNLACTSPILASVLRLVTNERMFVGASNPKEAVAFTDWLLRRPSFQLLDVGPEWDRFKTLVARLELRTNDIPDAQLAAIAQHRRMPIATFDKGFKKLLPASLVHLIAVPKPSAGHP